MRSCTGRIRSLASVVRIAQLSTEPSGPSQRSHSPANAHGRSSQGRKQKGRLRPPSAAHS
jgi:hypothetical protein